MICFTESAYEPMMNDNLRYRPPGRCFMQNMGGVAAMTSEELLNRLQECHKISVDKKTPYNYAKYGWIPAPRVINMGRAGGKMIDYDETTSAEFVASYRLKREEKASKEDVALARKVALEGICDAYFTTTDKGIDILLLSGKWKDLYKQALSTEDPEMRAFYSEVSKLYEATRETRKELKRQRMREINELFKDSDEQVECGDVPLTDELKNQWRDAYRDRSGPLNELITTIYRQAAAKAFGGLPEDQLKQRGKAAIIPEVVRKSIESGDK